MITFLLTNIMSNQAVFAEDDPVSQARQRLESEIEDYNLQGSLSTGVSGNALVPIFYARPMNPWPEREFPHTETARLMGLAPTSNPEQTRIQELNNISHELPNGSTFKLLETDVWSKQEREVVTRWISANQGAISLISEAADRGGYFSPIYNKLRSGLETLWPIYYKLLLISSRHNYRSGEIGDACKQWVDLIYLLQLRRTSGNPMASIQSWYWRNKAHESFVRIIEDVNIKKDNALKLYNKITQIPYTSDLRLSDGEFFLLLHVFIEYLEDRSGSRGIQIKSALEESGLDSRQAELVADRCPVNSEIAIARFRDVTNSIDNILRSGTPLEQTNRIENLVNQYKVTESRIKTFDSVINDKGLQSSTAKNMFSKIAADVLMLKNGSLALGKRWVKICWQPFVLRRLELTALALIIYKKRNNKFPTQLSDLHESDSLVSLEDPLSGDDFGYNHSDSSIEVYSVGFDFKNNGGDQEHDIVLRIPACSPK